ncbi:hypothetical protein Sbs19_43970 [Sphingobium sp. BS19]|nr:hypothetical protein Sbs19_43970 [Sphingobium sp. BS19]
MHWLCRCQEIKKEIYPMHMYDVGPRQCSKYTWGKRVACGTAERNTHYLNALLFINRGEEGIVIAKQPVERNH